MSSLPATDRYQEALLDAKAALAAYYATPGYQAWRDKCGSVVPLADQEEMRLRDQVCHASLRLENSRRPILDQVLGCECRTIKVEAHGDSVIAWGWTASGSVALAGFFGWKGYDRSLDRRNPSGKIQAWMVPPDRLGALLALMEKVSG